MGVYLDYGSVTLNGTTKRLMDRLQSALNATARLVHNSRKIYTTAFHHFCATCTGCASLNASSFVWPFLCSAVATRLHRTTWRETCSGQTRTTAIGNNTQKLLLRRTQLRSSNDRRPRLRRCCTARLERPACRHRFCTVTGHLQAALEDSSVRTIIRLTTDLVTCP